MKQKLAVLVTVMAVAILLSGCSLVMDVNTSIRKNGSGAVSVVYGLDEELYNGLASMDDGEDLSEFQPIERNGETLYGQEITQEFSSLSELNSLMTSEMDGAAESFKLFNSFNATKKGIQGVINNEVLGDEQAEIVSYGIVFTPTISFTFEREVEEANGRISQDRHTVTYNMLSDSDVNITVKGGVPAILVILLVIAALLAVVFLLIRGGKKTNPEAVPDANTVQTTNEEPVLSEKVVCPSCGAENEPGAVFCSNCGVKLFTVPPVSTTENTVAPTENEIKN